jgi:hypothetical protein
VLEHALPGGLAGESATAPEKVFASFFKKKRFLSVLRQETATDGEPIWDNEALESSMMSVLHTPRLILMPWRAGDWPRLQGLWNLPEVRRYLWDDTLVGRRSMIRAGRARSAHFCHIEPIFNSLAADMMIARVKLRIVRKREARLFCWRAGARPTACWSSSA